MVPKIIIVYADMVVTVIDRKSPGMWNQCPHALNVWRVGSDYLEGSFKPSETLRNLSSQGRVEKTFVIAEDKVDDSRDRDEGGLKLLVDIELVAGKYVEDTPQYTGKY
jgi:hypothetical protein